MDDLWSYVRPPRPGGSSNDEWLRTWRGYKFLALKHRYELLSNATSLNVPTVDRILATLPARPASGNAYVRILNDYITWAEVDVLEEAVILLSSDADVIEQLRARRVLYAQTVVTTEYDAYKTTMVPLDLVGTQRGPSIERVRYELIAITQRIKYVLDLQPPKERARATLTLYNTALMIGVALVMVVLYNPFITGFHLHPPGALLLVISAGLAGGFISVQQRLQEPTDVDPLLKTLDLKSSGFTLLLSPVIGLVFAVVFFGLLLAQVVSGPAFPTFRCDAVHLRAGCDGKGVAAFVQATALNTGADWAKLGIWSFAAGFLERLVPDILTRIAATADVKKKAV